MDLLPVKDFAAFVVRQQRAEQQKALDTFSYDKLITRWALIGITNEDVIEVCKTRDVSLIETAMNYVSGAVDVHLLDATRVLLQCVKMGDADVFHCVWTQWQNLRLPNDNVLRVALENQQKSIALIIAENPTPIGEIRSDTLLLFAKSPCVAAFRLLLSQTIAAHSHTHIAVLALWPCAKYAMDENRVDLLRVIFEITARPNSNSLQNETLYKEGLIEYAFRRPHQHGIIEFVLRYMPEDAKRIVNRSAFFSMFIEINPEFVLMYSNTLLVNMNWSLLSVTAKNSIVEHFIATGDETSRNDDRVHATCVRLLSVNNAAVRQLFLRKLNVLAERETIIVQSKMRVLERLVAQYTRNNMKPGSNARDLLRSLETQAEEEKAAESSDEENSDRF